MNREGSFNDSLVLPQSSLYTLVYWCFAGVSQIVDNLFRLERVDVSRLNFVRSGAALSAKGGAKFSYSK